MTRPSPATSMASYLTSRLLTKSSSGVLAALRGSTYGREYDSLAAALLDGLSEQPANDCEIVCEWLGSHVLVARKLFVNNLLDSSTSHQPSGHERFGMPLFYAAGSSRKRPSLMLYRAHGPRTIP